MRVLYHLPHPGNIYAIRTIYHGYKNAFEDLGHQFLPLTADDDPKKVLVEYRPHIFFTTLHPYHLRYINPSLLLEQKRKGLKIFISLPFWQSPFAGLRLNEARGLKDNPGLIRWVKEENLGDIYFSQAEQNDPRMNGFTETTGRVYHTIPLAADKTVCFPEPDKRFEAEISYIGTYLPEKRKFIRENVFPLKRKYDLKLYGQDWTFAQRAKGFVQKLGQYFNLPYLRSLQKPKLRLKDERKIYASSLVSINIHEEYQKRFGGDCNERTFKIPLCGGFEITDDVACIRKYFSEGSEIVIAKNPQEWFEKIEFYIRHPEKRLPIIEAGRKRVLQEHTYHHRVKQIIRLYHSL